MKSFLLEKHFIIGYNNLKKEVKVSVAKITRDFVSKLEDGRLFTYDDIPSANKSTVAIELSRLLKKGTIKKVSKGKFYKPKKRIFGEIGPSSNEKVTSLLKSTDGRSYETGFNGFRKLGLTTQVANEITIASNKQYKKVKLDNLNIKFVPKRIDAKDDEVYLVQILDALKDIKKIPATTPSEVIKYLKELIKKETIENQQKLTKFALKYTPRTRALLGAIFKDIGNKNSAYELKSTLNPLTSFKIDISDEVLKEKGYWNIK